MDFIQELKKRKVIRVALLYGAVAWLLIQVADTIAPLMGLSETAPRLVLFLLIILFPIALFLAWVYELKPEASEDRPTDQIIPPNTSRGFDRNLLYATFGVVLVIAGLELTDRFLLTEGGDSTGSIDGDLESVTGPVLRAKLNLGEVDLRSRRYVEVSPDGRFLALSSTVDGTASIWLIDLATGNRRKLVDREAPGTSLLSMSFSPDGNSLIYFDAGMYRVSVDGRAPQLLVESITPFGVGWDVDGNILYTTLSGIYRIPAVGGVSTRLGFPEGGELEYFYPRVVPNRDAVLAMEVARGGRHGLGNIIVLDERSGEIKTLVERAFAPRLTRSGHLLYAKAEGEFGTADLYIAPFDTATLSITGSSVRYPYPIGGGVRFGFSQQGRMVYLSENFAEVYTSPLVISSDRSGNTELLEVAGGELGAPRLSPDGEKLAVKIRDENAIRDLWIYDFKRKTFSRITYNLTPQDFVWTPDGRELILGQTRGPLWRVDASGIDEPVAITNVALGSSQIPTSVDSIQQRVLFTDMKGLGDEFDIYSVSLSEAEMPKPLLASPRIEEKDPMLSPDGKWLAYTSNETGRDEIYVRPYPDIDSGKWQVSSIGGRHPHWREDGGELIFANTSDKYEIYSVLIDTDDDGFSAQVPQKILSGDYDMRAYFGAQSRDYAVSKDHQRFIFTRYEEDTVDQSNVAELAATVVENWFVELDELAPTGSN